MNFDDLYNTKLFTKHIQNILLIHTIVLTDLQTCLIYGP